MVTQSNKTKSTLMLEFFYETYNINLYSYYLSFAHSLFQNRKYRLYEARNITEILPNSGEG